DIPGALRSVTAAETLSVPESAFAPGEPRVWQLALDVQSAARRAGVSPSPTASISDAAPQSMVRQASDVQPAGGTQANAGSVVNSLYNASDDNTKVQPAQALNGPGESESESGGPGEALYRQGLDA